MIGQRSVRKSKAPGFVDRINHARRAERPCSKRACLNRDCRSNLDRKRQAAPEQRITDGTVSSDGRWVVLRTRASLVFYRTADFVKGEWREARRVDLTSLREPQGEGVALGAGDTVYVAGEGGGKKQPGTLARFTCEPES